MKTNYITWPRVLSVFLGLVLLAAALPVLATSELNVEVVQPAAKLGLADYVPGEVLVKFKNSNVPFEVMPVPDVEAAIVALGKNPNVEYAGPNYLTHAALVPNDPGYNQQWNFGSDTGGGVNAETAWDVTRGAGTVVAIIDSGVAYEDYSVRRGRRIIEQYSQAPDLAGTCFEPGYDFINNDSHPNDDNGHGTHVAGTIAQTTNNNMGVAGLAFETCIMPIKALDASGGGTYAELIDAIHYATDNGADVINMSLSGSAYSNLLENAVAYAYNNGVTVVAATGNEDGAVGYPAAHDAYVIAVGATDSTKTRASFSNYGTSIDIVAPGVSILQQTFNQTTGDVNDWSYYYFMSGTSMAAPHVAAAAAMVMSNGNATTPAEVRAALEATAGDLGDTGYDIYYGNGLLDVTAALAWSPVPVNHAPVADAGTHQSYEVPLGDSISVPVTLSGSNSYDPDGDQLTFYWTGGDILSTSTGEIYSTTLTATGTYTYTLRVSDGVLSDTDEMMVTIVETDPNQLPTASFTNSVTDLTVNLDASGSSDADGDPLSYSWTFGDGNTDTGVKPSYTYAAEGTYTVTLTVDDGTDTDSVSSDVTVTAPPPSPITLDVTTRFAGPNAFVELSWTGTNGALVDVYRDGAVITTTTGNSYSDKLGKSPVSSYAYRVCEAGSTTNCSEEQIVNF